jgi:hypothetical protein
MSAESKKDLACIVNGHTPPPDAEVINLPNRWSSCKVCGQSLRINKMWGGMNWKITWSPVGRKI